MGTLLFYFSTFLVFEWGPQATGPGARGNPYACKVPSGSLESGRSVRVNSHADVPEEERVVTFKMFQVVVPGIGPTTPDAHGANWLQPSATLRGY